MLNYNVTDQKTDPAVLPGPDVDNPNVVIGQNSFLHNCTINDYTYLSKNVSMMNTKVGKFCSIGQGVCVCLGRHPSSVFVSTHPAFFSVKKQNGMTFSNKEYYNETGKTIIGNDVWIGVNAIIMDDITVGNGAIIGAGAVVTKNIPAYAIAVGIPAKVIKYRFEPKVILFLEKFKWWDKSPEWLQDHFKELHDIEMFMDKHDNSNN